TLLGLILYTNFLGQLHLKTDFGYIKKPLAKAMANYSLYGLLNALGSQVAFRIDTLMVAGIIGITSSGVYAIVNVISDAIMKPAKGIIAISSPIISRSWKNNDLDEIRMIYKKSSVVLLTLGWLVFLGIWGSIDDLISIMENSEIIQQGKYVVLVLGLAKIIDLATSVNSEIISYSKKYQFNFYALLILAVLNIVLNLVFIPIYGLVGSAIATFCSVSIFNISKLIFIWVNFKMQPFTFTTLKILCVVGFCWSVIYFVSFNFHPIINIILRSTLLTVLYGSIILYFKISPDVNEMLYKWLKKFGW
ncbi:MAG: polysaccharide biosynthesis C-terminal domain-containing protein, partial [Bacteroidota bacterium]